MDIPERLPEGQYAIYALIDPTDGSVYYVGQTRKPQQRFAAHLGMRHHAGEKAAWLRRLVEQGQQPHMQILEMVAGEKLALAQEQAWIRHFREKGMLLFNASPGLGSKLLSRRRPFTPLRHETVNIEGCSIQIVWLSDRRIAVLLLPLCEAFHLNYSGQLQRIRRNDFLAKHLLLVRVSTKGGMQSLEALVISAIPRLLEGIQMNRLVPEKRPQARALQQRAEEVLKRYVSGPRQPLSQDGPILTAEHRNQVYALARHLRDQTGEPVAVLFAELAETFGVEDMSDIPDAGWEEVAAWFWKRRQRD